MPGVMPVYGSVGLASPASSVVIVQGTLLLQRIKKRKRRMAMRPF